MRYTEAQIAELFERSKDDRAIIVGSEVRVLCAMAQELLEQRAEEKTTGGRPFGCALATAVLQSDEYRRLDDEARAECDELIERWKRWLKPRSDGPHGSQDV